MQTKDSYMISNRTYVFFILMFVLSPSCKGKSSTSINSELNSNHTKTDNTSNDSVNEQNSHQKMNPLNTEEFIVLNCDNRSMAVDKVAFTLNYENKKIHFDQIYFDQRSHLIFLINDKEKNITIYSLCLGLEKFFMNLNYKEIFGFFKYGNNRFFVEYICNSCDKPEVWEFEFELDRIDYVDLNSHELEKIQKLLP